MTNSRIALAVLAALSTFAALPADARPAKAKPQVFDAAAAPAYPTAEMPGSAGRRAATPAVKASRTGDRSGRSYPTPQQASYEELTFLPHPPGCPRIAFCACGAAVKIFGEAKRSLWPVSAWRQFARDAAAPGNVAIERGRSHLFVLVSHVSGDDWLVDDFNSGGHRSRRHVRSIGHATIVNPHAHRTAALTAKE